MAKLRDEHISLRVDSNTKNLVQTIASARDESVSEFIVDLIFKEIAAAVR